jgi:hypothetical protein
VNLKIRNYKEKGLIWFFGIGHFGESRALVDIATPFLEECEDETHTPEMGTWESTGTPKISEFDFKDQNTSH